MTESALSTLTEDELDVLVSIAIRRAEVLEDSGSAAAHEAWHEVMLYEERLAAIIPPDEIPGGVARAGAVAAALASGDRQHAKKLASFYLAEGSLPVERRTAIEKVFREEQVRLARRFPTLAKSGRLAELDE